MTRKTRIVFFLLHPIGTIAHLHAVPRIFFAAGDVLSPDIPAVTCDAVLFIYREFFDVTEVTVTGLTAQINTFYVRNVIKVNTVRLPVVG